MNDNNDAIKYLMVAHDQLLRARVVMMPKFEDDPREKALEIALLEVKGLIEYLQSGRDPVLEMIERKRLLDELMKMPLSPLYLNVLPFDEQ